MMQQTCKGTTVLAAAAILALIAGTGGPARADYLKLLDASDSSIVTITYNNGGGSSTEEVYAGYYNMELVTDASGNTAVAGKQPFGAFCTDLWDNINVGETWQATPTTTSAGLGTLGAPAVGGYPVALSPKTIAEIDYLAQNYPPPPDQAAAQIAIWDLVENGTSHNLYANGGAWGSNFSAVFDSNPSNGQDSPGWTSTADMIGAVSTLEGYAAQAVGSGSPSFGSDMEIPTLGTVGGNDNRAQDLVFSTGKGTNGPLVSTVPEPAYVQCATITSLSAFSLLWRKRRSRIAA
jgi:hypothetical protein